MARLLGALGRLGGSDKKRPSSMQPLKAGESLEQKLGGEAPQSKGGSGAQLETQGKPMPKPPATAQGKGPSSTTPTGSPKVFGAPLEEVMARHPGAKIPPVVAELIGYLRMHGLAVDGVFRVPGDNNELQRLKSAYDSGVPVDIEAATDVHGAASLLKHYLRDLPDPLLTFAFYPTFIALQSNPDAQHRLEQTKRIVTKSLPDVNRDLLDALLEFLTEVAAHSGQNKMDISNLAKVFGPTLLRAEKDNMVQMLEDARYVLSLIRLLLEEYHYIFDHTAAPKGALDSTGSGSDAQIFPELKEDIRERLQKKQPSLARIQQEPGVRQRSSSLSDTSPAQAAAAARLVAIPAPSARSATPTPDKGRRKALNMKVEIPQGALSDLLSSPELLLSPGRGPSNKDEIFAKLEQQDSTGALAASAPPALSKPASPPPPSQPDSSLSPSSVSVVVPSVSAAPSTTHVRSPSPLPGRAGLLNSGPSGPLDEGKGPIVSKLSSSTGARAVSPGQRTGAASDAERSERSNDPRLSELVAAMTARLVGERAEVRRPSKVEDMNQEELKAEELALKRELAGYDKAFAEMFGEPPKREDRFPLKPLAERYKQVLKSLGMPPPGMPVKTFQQHQQQMQLKSSAGVPSGLANNPQYAALVQRKREAKAAIDAMQKEFETKHGRRPETNEEKLPFAPLLKAYLDIKGEMALLEDTANKKQ